MILAGIDEAGYGPLLGPLVVGCCAFQVETPPGQDPQCLWKRLSRVASKTRPRSASKIHINDSKLVYSPSTGLRELERSILAITAAWQSWPDDLNAFLRQVAADAVPDLQQSRWYGKSPEERFPVEQDAMPIKLFANALKVEMQRTKACCVHLAARVLEERQLNRHLNNTRNKSSTLFSLAAIHLDHLLRTYGNQGLVIFCDRQGGREHYGNLLRLMFEDWNLTSADEIDGRSEYRLVRNSHEVKIIFCEKAESQCMPVAIASMLCKYLRETLMMRFNAFWQQHVPGLQPTAGYYTDGMRFLQDIQTKRAELGIPDDQIIRSR